MQFQSRKFRCVWYTVCSVYLIFCGQFNGYAKMFASINWAAQSAITWDKEHDEVNIVCFTAVAVLVSSC